MDFMHALPSKLAATMLETVMKQLTSSAIKEIAQIWDIENELKALLATYEKIKAVVDKCNMNPQIKNGSSALETWLQDLEGYCYDTEDLVDDLTLSCPSNVPVRNQTLVQLIPASLSKKRLTTPRKIVKLRGKLENTCGWIESVLATRQNDNSTQIRQKELISLLSDQTPLVSGTSRDWDKQAIVKELISIKPRCSGVSIVGIDGLGKTALARTILADDTIKSEFPLILCADVSREFGLGDVVHKLFQNLQGNTELYQNQTVRCCFQELLLGEQKTLIVLDDLWSVTNEDWERFECNYLNLSPGWKVLITTRNPNVAEVTESIPHYLDRMTDEDCTRLIMEKSNLSESDRVIWGGDIELIAKKCKGLPIIAGKVGLTLSKKRSVEERMDAISQFKNISNLLELPGFGQVLPCLILNKQKLASHLKRCFAYCSMFSPNHRFIKHDLIQLWEVEGFVRNDSLSGSQCFDDLLSRSLLQPLSSSNGKQSAYKMHEFSHEFAEHLASKTFHRIDEGTTKLPSTCKSIRHLSLGCQNVDISLLKQIKECKRLRTFLLLHRRVPNKRTISYSSFPKLESLRLLDLSHTDICKLQKCLNPLKHLRYLDLSESDIQTLPEPICSFFRALQVLKLENCSKLDRLPKDLNQLISLRCLHVNMKLLGRQPSNLGMLTNLESLSSFVVGNSEGNKVAELRNMDHLREICISHLENIGSINEAQESMLSTKRMLRKLVLEWVGSNDKIMPKAVDVLEGLEPENDLKDLVVRNYKCHQFPAWLVSPSRKLVSVYLENCHDCKVLPSIGQLPLLKTLVLHSFDTLEIVDRRIFGQGEIGFPSLESLEFRDMKKLLYWIGLEVGDLPCLRNLKIIDCPRLAYLSPLNHQVCLLNLEIVDCPALKSLPNISSSLNGERGKIVIRDSPLVEQRCQAGGADWPKVKDNTYMQKFCITRTSTTSTGEALGNDKIPQDERKISKHCCSTTTPKLDDGNHILQDGVITNQNQPASSQLQHTITNEMGEVHLNEHPHLTPLAF